MEIGDGVVTGLVVRICQPQQEVGELRIPVRVREVEGCGTTVAVFCLDHPGCSDAGANSVVAELDRDVVENVAILISLEVRSALVGQTYVARGSEVNSRSLTVRILISSLTGEGAGKR